MVSLDLENHIAPKLSLMATHSSEIPRKRGLVLPGLATQVLIALGLGVLCGIFFGERVAFLKIGGDAYIRLILMTVLPYVVTALIAGIGRLAPSLAAVIGIRSAALMAFLSIVSFTTIVALPLAYPNWASGSFYSSGSSAPPATINPLEVYIPANVFESLAQTAVPAVVVFCIALAVSLIGIEKKSGLLDICDTLVKALGRLASFVTRLAPLGIFAIAASSAGTMRIDEFGNLQVFLITYAVGFVILTFLALPLLVVWATPLSYRAVVYRAQTALLTAFATGTIIVVIPLIAEQCKTLIEESGIANDETRATVDVLAPSVASLPHAGTFMNLGFILFAAWFMGSALEGGQLLSFVFVGGLSAFGGTALSIQYMLDFFRLPHDLFQLHLLASVILGRLATTLAAMNGVVICLLGAFAVAGRLQVRRLVHVALANVVFSLFALSVLGFALQGILPHRDTSNERLLAMRLIGEPVPISYVESPEPLSPMERQQSRLQAILERGTIRVGAHRDRLPFVFTNDQDELVGFDMQLVYELARDLGVSVVTTGIEWEDSTEWLESGRIDLIVGGVSITLDRALYLTYTRSYINETLGFLVRDHRRREFADLDRLRRVSDLKLALLPPYAQRYMRRLLPNAEFVEVESARDFLGGGLEGVDAMIFPVQSGSAWTLLYPRYSIVIPDGFDSTVPVAFVVPDGSAEFLRFLNSWLDLKIKNGLVDLTYRQWILGEDVAGTNERWSIIRDVLHWVD